MGLATTPRHVLTAVDVMMTTLDGRVPGRRLGVLAADHVRTRLQIAGYRVTDLNAGPPEGPLDALVVGQVPELHPDAPVHVRGSIEARLPIFATSTHGQMPTRVAGVLSAGQVLAAVTGSADEEVGGDRLRQAVDVLRRRRRRADGAGRPGAGRRRQPRERHRAGQGQRLVRDAGGRTARGRDGPVPDYWAPDLASVVGR